jgi:peptide/nickel transport system permease protein
MVNWRKFFRSKQNWLGLILVSGFFFVAIAAPWLAPPPAGSENRAYVEIRRGVNQLPAPPGPGSVLGTVPKPRLVGFGIPAGQGRIYQWDVYHTLVWGTRAALRFGLTVTLLTATFGIFVGALSGYIGGATGRLMMRVTDAFLAFPVIAGVWIMERVVFSALNSPFGLPLDLTPLQGFLVTFDVDAIQVALILFCWMPYARLVNGAVAQLKDTEFVVASKALGAGGVRIVGRHLLPNTLSSSIVMAARDVGGMVILASAFIFIGLHGTLPWAVMLVGGRDYIMGSGGNPFTYWWVFVPIVLALILFSVGWNLLGDGLNTALNPRSANR